MTALLAAEDFDKIIAVCGERMTFGTAGLRGTLAAGYGCMNSLTVTQASQGLYAYVASQTPDLKTRGIVIGHDARYQSRSFSCLAAIAFMHHGVPVRLFSKVVPTPYVPFGVTHFGAAAGIMVTASHNPAKDNGYKVYWGDGVQITSPHDKGIEAAIQQNLVPWAAAVPDYVEREAAVARFTEQGLLSDPFDTMLPAYHTAIKQVCFTEAANASAHEHVKVAYSAMHGVGYQPSMDALAAFGFDVDRFVVPVEDQVRPDPSFPTSAKPNPEERANMEHTIPWADKGGANVVLANDPDADRLAVAEKQPNGEWHILHGNEIGALLADWLLTNKYGGKVPADKKVVLLNSTVSSKFLRALAAARGCEYKETLTGFKWIGRHSIEYVAEGYDALFGFEEAIGFMCGSAVRDKDGVSACAVMSELVSQAYASGKTLMSRLSELYDECGHFVFDNFYWTCESKELIDAIFARLRGPKDASGRYAYLRQAGRFAVRSIRDMTAPGFDDSQPDLKPILPVSSAHMLTYTFENGADVTLRTSGTEPKLKAYCEMAAASAAAARQELAELVDAFESEMIGAKEFGLSR
jgi:phosphomannomutase